MGRLNMFQILKQTKGASILLVVILFAIAIFIGQQFILVEHLNNLKVIKYTQIREMRMSVLSSIEELLSTELTLRNSRFSTNTQLESCLLGTSVPPCDESLLYDMILYSPNPPMIFSGGSWAAVPPPVSLSIVASGMAAPTFLNLAGGPCDTPGLMNATERCPLQAIAQFRPLCGGSLSIPDYSVPGGAPCTGPANGIEVVVGIGILMNGQFVYHQKTDPDGDARLLRVSANLFRN